MKETTLDPNARQAPVEEYLARGWIVVPIPRGAKVPKVEGWQTGRFGAAWFRGDENIGVHLGPSGLVDIDLDCAEAIELAPQVLGATATFGRESKPRSHWIYRCEGVRYRKFVDPIDGTCILEIRAGQGKQTVFPGSVHGSGEPIEWCDDAPIAELDPSLRAAWLAVRAWCLKHGTDDVPTEVASWVTVVDPDPEPEHSPADAPAVLYSGTDETLIDLIVKHYPAKGSRHDYRLAVAGAMWRAGIAQDAARAMLTEATERAGAKVEDVAPAVADTWSGARHNTGAATLVNTFNAKAVADRIDVLTTPTDFDDRSLGGAGVAQPQGGGRPARLPIQLHAGELEAPINDSIEALSRASVFWRGSHLVDVTREPTKRHPDGAPRIRPVPQARLRELLSIHCVYLAWDKSGKRREVSPPHDIVTGVLARGAWPGVRPLEGICYWPVVRPDGSIFEGPGYDPATRLLCESRTALEVPEHPTHEDARAAVRLLSELVCDFPFAQPVHRTAWLAALLTPLARHAFDGPTPLTLVAANERGSGKTKLASLVKIITTGEDLPVRTAPKTSEEWGKVILSIAMAGTPIVVLDNVTKMLRSDDLDAVLSSTSYSGRVLGESRDVSLPWHTCLLATANNPNVSGDMVRRSVLVRLDAPENPEQREGFKIPNIEAHAIAHRDRYLSAALTILRAYFAAGRPDVSMRPMGSYEAWSGVVRAALVWAGEPDPAVTQDELRETADPEREDAGALFRAWRDAFEDRAVTTREVAEQGFTFGDSPLRDAIDGLGIERTSKALGYRLRGLRGRTVDGLRLESERDPMTNATHWRVVQVG